ncbi:hypothetical protein C4D60_Mb09t02300 [Musa balbisiana]|uniref:Uncharacterized protein n=1 Tax=Musa balbisiana TaxID=52838 RepID=A0A4S8IDG3_MUSBA|nr:hypothetical protein C4D60_Mb09t02300 [Musa balbisiana]
MKSLADINSPPLQTPPSLAVQSGDSEKGLQTNSRPGIGSDFAADILLFTCNCAVSNLIPAMALQIYFSELFAAQRYASDAIQTSINRSLDVSPHVSK